MKAKICSGMLAASLLLIGLPVAAQAPASDCLTVFGPTGLILFQVCATEADEGANGGQSFVITDSSLANPALFGSPTILLDPDEGISDIFGIVMNGPGCSGLFCLAFASDTETPLAGDFGSVTPFIFPEGLGVFDATFYLAPSLQAQLFTAQFTSDSEVAVPEPATIALLGLGILTLGFARRRRLGTHPR